MPTIDEQLQAIYAELPTMDCQRKCQEYCGPLLIPRVEFFNIENAGMVLSLGPISAVQLGPGWEWMDKKKLVATVPEPDGHCSLLYPTGKCRIYDRRPLVCRIWGMVGDDVRMQCPHGCRPSRWLTNKEARVLTRRVLEIQP
jgi:uncharacterized protein